jgi:uncharacterized membrane protein
MFEVCMKQPARDRIVVTSLVALQLTGLLLVAALTLSMISQWHGMDLQIYYNDSLQLISGKLPYRDFPLEYPPLALIPFVVPRLITPGQRPAFTSYVWLFAAQNALFSTLIALTLARIAALLRPSGRGAWVLGGYALLVTVCAPLAPWRFDMFPAMLTLLALLAVLLDRPALAGIWLGLGVAAKLYPAACLPIVGAYYLASRRYRALALLILGSIGTAAICLAPFFLLDPGGWLSFVQYHELRGMQIESLPAGAIALAHVLGLTPAALTFNYGALQLVSPVAEMVLKWQPLASILVLGLVYLCCLGRFRAEQTLYGAITDESLVAFLMAALLAFIAVNKVFSPQYVLWLLPFAALLRPRQAGVMLIICILTISIFPFTYDRLLAMQLPQVLMLNLRNALVLALLIWLLVERPLFLPRADGRRGLAWPQEIRPETRDTRHEISNLSSLVSRLASRVA